jgi:hypothetical protein
MGSGLSLFVLTFSGLHQPYLRQQQVLDRRKSEAKLLMWVFNLTTVSSLLLLLLLRNPLMNSNSKQFLVAIMMMMMMMMMVSP